MTLPLDLPVLQNWSCHSCGGCCRQHAIEITEEERQRILAQGWTPADGIPADQPVIESQGWPWNRRYFLAHQADGACAFLDENGLCRIHAKFGEPAKPLACRIYPFAFHPAGRTIAVSLRFSCPSVVGNRGRPVRDRKAELRDIQKLVVPEGTDRIPPPPISPSQRLDWPDTLRIIDHLRDQLADDDVEFPQALLRTLFVVNMLGQAQFDKIRGERLGELLDILAQGAADEVPTDLDAYPEPSRGGRMQFRLLVMQYSRKDTAATERAGLLYRYQLFKAALRFTHGRGQMIPLQDCFAAIPFATLEQPFGPVPEETWELFQRYFDVKLQGQHFCGKAYFDVPLVEGFQSLALVVPAVLYLARWLAASQQRATLTAADVEQALAIADHHHGYSPAFGQIGFRNRVRLLARAGDLQKLIAWYAKG